MLLIRTIVEFCCLVNWFTTQSQLSTTSRKKKFKNLDGKKGKKNVGDKHFPLFL